MEDKIMADPREILGSIAIIYRSHLACMAKEFEAYRIGSGQFDFFNGFIPQGWHIAGNSCKNA